MEYKITPSSCGGFTVAAGRTCKGSEPNPTGCPGVTMPAFIVYESCHCDTRLEAAAAVERMKKKHH